MAWATEMASLVHGIKASHRMRAGFLSSSKKQTHDLLAEDKKFMKDVADELRVMANELKDFLAKSEDARMTNFKSLLAHIQDRIKKIAKDTRELLSDSESSRMSDFAEMEKGIENAIDGVKKSVVQVRKSARDLLGGYESERKEAAAHWASLPERETPSEKAAEKVEEPKQVHKKSKK